MLESNYSHVLINCTSTKHSRVKLYRSPRVGSKCWLVTGLLSVVGVDNRSALCARGLTAATWASDRALYASGTLCWTPRPMLPQISLAVAQPSGEAVQTQPSTCLVACRWKAQTNAAAHGGVTPHAAASARGLCSQDHQPVRIAVQGKRTNTCARRGL